MTVPANQSDQADSSDVRIVEISREPVELYKILKFEGMVTSGGEAKAVVAAGQVLVNGKVENQKRKKIVSGDTIEFNSETITINFTPTVAIEAPPLQTAVEPVANESVVEPASDCSVAVDVEKNESKRLPSPNSLHTRFDRQRGQCAVRGG